MRLALAAFLLGAGGWAFNTWQSNGAYWRERARVLSSKPDAESLLEADENWKESANEIGRIVETAAHSLHTRKLDDTPREILAASFLVDGQAKKDFKAWCATYMMLRTSGLSKEMAADNLRAFYALEDAHR